MQNGKPIRRWTVEPVKAPAQTPVPAEPSEVPVPVVKRDPVPA